MSTRRPVMPSPAWGRAQVAAIAAAHAVCNGLVIADRVRTGGDAGLGRYDPAAVLVSAAVVACAGTAAALAAHARARVAPSATRARIAPGGAGWRGVAPARPWYVAFGPTVALVLPVVWGVAQDSRPADPFGHTVLMYSLPWGLGLAAAGWLRGRTAVAAGVIVAVSALMCAALVVGPDLIAYFSPPPVDD
ncbi:hypothetical protein ACWKSP_35060 [Micromonosporaceae bacterium Da 78-11]